MRHQSKMGKNAARGSKMRQMPHKCGKRVTLGGPYAVCRWTLCCLYPLKIETKGKNIGGTNSNSISAIYLFTQKFLFNDI
jgi:hypothetical protein